jgi:hypothetical protein
LIGIYEAVIPEDAASVEAAGADTYGTGGEVDLFGSLGISS